MLLQKAENQQGFFKSAIYGLQGSGKTYTGCNFAVGLHHLLKERGLEPGPVAMFDTERGSDFAVPHFNKHQIDFYVKQSRSFKQAIQVIDECIKEKFSIIIIDSISHIWQELTKSFMQKYKVSRLAVHHWGPIKEEWKQLTERVINANLHMILLGRAANDYELLEKEDEMTGKISYDVVKTGYKFRAEGEFGYEPSIVFRMERVRLDEGEVHRAYCEKDRNMNPDETLDGKYFDNPSFEILSPHLKCLNLGTTSEGVDVKTSSEDIFDDKDKSRVEHQHRRKVLREEILNELQLAFPGRSDRAQKARLEIGKFLLGTTSETALQRIPLPELENARALVDIACDYYHENGKVPDKEMLNKALVGDDDIDF